MYLAPSEDLGDGRTSVPICESLEQIEKTDAEALASRFNSNISTPPSFAQLQRFSRGNSNPIPWPSKGKLVVSRPAFRMSAPLNTVDSTLFDDLKTKVRPLCSIDGLISRDYFYLFGTLLATPKINSWVG